MVEDSSSREDNQTLPEKYNSRLSFSKMQDQRRSFHISDTFFWQIVASLEDYAIFTIDEEGNVSLWNSNAEHIFGYAGEEIIGQPTAILFHVEDQREKVPDKELQEAIKRGRESDQRWYIKKGGSQFWASSLVFSSKNAEGRVEGFIKVILDLTEKKRHKEEQKLLIQQLEAEKRKLVDVFERAPAFMAMLFGKNHIFEMANTAAW